MSGWLSRDATQRQSSQSPCLERSSKASFQASVACTVAAPDRCADTVVPPSVQSLFAKHYFFTELHFHSFILLNSGGYCTAKVG